MAESRHTTGTVKKLWWPRADTCPKRVKIVHTSKHGSSIRSAETTIRNGDYDTRLAHNERVYSSRYGWQISNYPSALSPTRHTNTHNNPDRYGHRPSYGNDNYSSGTNKPGSTYGANYGDTRPHGNVLYGSKPGYGSYNEGGEYNGPVDHAYQEVAGPQVPPGIIQTQKAVALKALAGVALIGAAAALATNPVLMPIGVISGRRKRSDTTNLRNDNEAESVETFKNLISKIGQGNDNFAETPHCIARLICKIQKGYIEYLKHKDVILSKDKNILHIMELWFINLMPHNMSDINYVSSEVKKLIKLAVLVASSNQDCRAFSCDVIED